MKQTQITGTMTNFKTHKELAAMISKDIQIQKLFITQWENITGHIMKAGYPREFANRSAFDVLVTDDMFYKSMTQALKAI